MRLASIVVLIASFVAGRAAAATPEQQVAQALFDEARRLLDQGRFSEACPKFAESHRMDPGGGTLANLAACHEHEGKLAEAYSEYNEALSIAVRDGRKERQELIRGRLAVLEASVPRVTVTVPPASDAANLDVKLDGITLHRAAWGVPIPANPGPHAVEASAPARATWSLAIQLEPGQRRHIEVPVLGPARVVADAGLAPPSSRTRTNPVFVTLVGVTLTATAVSLVTGLVATIDYAKAKTGCLEERHYCSDPDARSSADTARTMAWVSTVSLGVGVASGLSLIVVPPRVSDPSSTGLGVGGTF